MDDLEKFFVSQNAGQAKPSVDSLEDFFKKGQSIRVQRTLDADTLEETGHGKQLVDGVRFEGIDAPEMSQGNLGKTAQDYLDSELAGAKAVHVVPRGRDFHGRVIGTVYADGRNVNLELVRKGHAKAAYLDGLTPAMKKQMEDAEDEAREAGLGIWADDSGYQDSAEFRAAERAAKGQAAGAEGHDARPRVDEGARSVREVARSVELSEKDRDAALEQFFRGGGKPSGPSGNVAGNGGSPGGGSGEDDKGFLDSVLDGLDYAGNASRSFLLGANEANARGEGLIDQAVQGADYGLQALKKDRKTTATQLKDAMTTKWGVGKLRAGKDDGDFDVGDIADVGADLVLDIVTDPLTYVTAGASRLAKGGTQVAKGLTEAKLGMDTAAAVKAAKIHAGTRAALGAVYGVGSVDDDGDFLDHIGGAAIGAGLGLAAGPAMDKFGKVARGKFDKVSNWYATTTRGTRFADFATQRMVALGAYDKVKNIAEWIRQGRLNALKELSPEERLQATSIMQSLKTETIRQRAELVEKFGLKEGTAEWNQMAQSVNKAVVDDFLPNLLAGEGEKVGKAVSAWKDHNEAVVKKFNKTIHGLEDGIPKDGLGLVGVSFHVDDVAKLEDFEKASESFRLSRVYQAKGLERSKGVLEDMRAKYKPLLESGQMTEAQFKQIVHDTNYAIYAEKFSKNFLDEMEQKAVHLMREHGETKAFGLAPGEIGVERQGLKVSAVRGAEKALGGLDKLTNFAKANMLYFSLSWLKNNYFDNIAKSYVENGMSGLVDTAATGLLKKNLSKDVWKLYKGDVSHLFKADEFGDMMNLGVLDNPMYKSMTDEMTRDFMFRPADLAKAGEKSLANYMTKAGDLWFSKNPVISLVARTGSYMEGTARAITYSRTLEALNATKSLDAVKPHVKKQMAAKVVKETFFDYSDVSHFEGAVLKRLVPFYSFYAKNMPYWIKSVFDPEKAGRVLALEKVRHNIGKEPTAGDRAGMTPYLADSAPRKLGLDAKGNQQFLISPSTSMHDAIKTVNPKDWLSQFVEKSTPIPKAVVELVSGKDAFSGDDLYPDEEQGGKKYLYSRGFKWVVIKRTLEALGAKPDSVFQKVAGTSGVDVDGNGNPYTTEGWTVVVDRITSTLLPHGFVDQVAGSVGKYGAGKESLDEVIYNRLAPMQNVKVSPSFARMVRVRKLAERAKENK